MSNTVKTLTGDQLRRIFRDYLAGRPKEKLMKKYDISEAVFWEIVGLYSKKKHPNDVGNAQDIEGPMDVLVSGLDTGSTANEGPTIARNPTDLEKGDVKKNLEETDGAIKELTKASETAKAEINKAAAEAAKAQPSTEELLKARNEKLEKDAAVQREADALRDQKLRGIEDVETEGTTGSNVGQRGSSRTGDSAKAQGNKGGAVPANTSPTAQPNPVEPAKVEPAKLEEKEGNGDRKAFEQAFVDADKAEKK